MYKIFFLFLFPIYLCAVDIALTIDDYPMADGPILTAEIRTQAFIEICEKHACKAAFFCIGNHCTSDRGAKLLLQLDANGHFICNHSMHHLHLSSQSLEDFENEVKQVDQIISTYQNSRRWYRFPFLDYGHRIPLGGSYEKALLSLQVLNRLGYSEGYVTINTFDWYLDQKLSEAMKNGYLINCDALKNVYIELLKSWCDYYIDVYAQAFPENITHTLLLHANDLNAFFLPNILNMIKASGWNLVSPEKAFSNLTWRNKILKNPEIIMQKPFNLNCEEIDKLLLQEKVFLMNGVTN